MPPPCPIPADLTRFAGGELDDDALEAVGAHLDGCAACRAVVDAVPELVVAAAVPSDADSGVRRVADLVLLVPPPPSDGSGWADAADPLPERFDRFRVVGRLGAGAMGVVYEAEDEQLGRRVAVKVLRAAFAARPGARERFVREGRAVAALRHPNVVTIHHVGAAGDVPFLVMELLAGESLGARVRRGGAVAAADAVRIGCEVAAGLAAAHAAGLVHRDVTPDNVWLTAGGPAKLLDFGLVRAGGDAVVTHPGTIVGTPRYMAPEQARADAADHRADVFGLGAVLYYALTAAYPFPGDDVLAVLAAHASHAPPPADRVNRAVPAPLARVVGRMLEKDPARRPPTADDAAARLADSLVPRRRRWPVTLGLALAGAVAVGVLIRPHTDPPPAPDPVPPAPAPVVVAEPAPDFGVEVAAGTVVEIPGLDLLADDFTVEFFVRPAGAVPDASAHLLGVGRQASVFADGGGRLWGIGFRVRGAFHGVKFPAPRAGEWTHVALVKETQPDHRHHNHVRAYVGGRVANDLLAPPGALDPARGPFTVGPGLAADLDELRVSSAPRYDADFTPARRFDPDPHTLALYHCDDPDSPVLRDASGRARHGAVRGGKALPRSAPR